MEDDGLAGMNPSSFEDHLCTHSPDRVPPIFVSKRKKKKRKKKSRLKLLHFCIIFKTWISFSKQPLLRSSTHVTLFYLFQRTQIMKYLKKHARDLPMTGQKRIPFYMKVFFIILACAACIITIFSESIFLRTRGDISCFYQHGNLLTELNAEEPLSGASIFFHETSCHDSIDIHFKPRQACSVESALLAHPEKSEPSYQQSNRNKTNGPNCSRKICFRCDFTSFETCSSASRSYQ